MIVSDTFLLLSASLKSAVGSGQWAGIPADRRLPTADSWIAGDIPRAAALLHDAYPQEIGRHFAPNGTAPEWRRYVTALVTERACGTFDAHLTRVIRDDAGLRALALVTRVAPDVAHLAQLAVRPDARRQGVARALVEDAAATAAAAGCERLTLLVAASNAPARRLYESLGFRSIPQS